MLLAGYVVARVVATHAERSPTLGTSRVWPSGEGRLVGRVVDEEDGVQLALHLLGARVTTSAERQGFASALHTEYARLRAARGLTSTPLVATLLGAQRATAFDVIHYAPDATSDDAVVFFHGSAGNWGLLCALVSEGANGVGLHSYCPSTSARGRWDTRASRTIVRETLSRVSETHPGRVFLVALSNGAASASAMVEDARATLRSGALRGVVLLFGIDARLDAGVDTLVVYGASDERFRPEVVRRTLDTLAPRYAGRAALDAVSVPGDHFALVKNRVSSLSPLTRFLEERQ
jgi:poly(3-hydroxybutyrate) depolymerase